MAAMGAVEAVEASETKSVTYRVKGFSCITCAVGLDAMLQQQPGVARSKSTYAEGTVRIEFHPHLVSENVLKAFIAQQGFAVLDAQSS